MTDKARSYTNAEIRDLLKCFDQTGLIALCQDEFIELYEKIELARSLRKDETVNEIMDCFIREKSFAPLLAAIKRKYPDLYDKWSTRVHQVHSSQDTRKTTTRTEPPSGETETGPGNLKAAWTQLVRGLGRLRIWIRKHFVAMSVGVLLVVCAIPLGQQVWQANRVEQALEAGVCLILASLIFLLSLLLLQGKGSGKEPEERNETIVKQPGEAPGYFKRLRNRVARLNKKSLLALLGMGILGLLLTTIGGITQVTFKSRESKCLSVKVSPSLLLNIPVGIGGAGIGKPVDPLQGSTVIPLSREQIGNLTNLSGQPILTGSTADCTCNWRVSVNNAPPAPIASSSCTFSIPLSQKEQVTSISLWLEIGSDTEPFNVWGLTARKQTKIFNIQVK